MLPLATTALENSIEQDPKNPIYDYHLGLAYASGEDAPARAALAIAPALPRADVARKVLASLVY